MTWQLHHPDSEGDLHVTPNDDFKPHLIAACCWCSPTRDCRDPSIVIHHALDQRERYESGELRLQ